MHNIRVGGVCLLLLLIAAALPFIAMAQEPQTGSSSAPQSDSTGNDAASIISKSLAAKTGQEEAVSAERVTSSRRGLKSLSSSADSSADSGAQSTASDQGSSPQTAAAPAGTDTAAESAETAGDAVPSQAAADAPMAAAEEVVTPDEIEAETVEAAAGKPELVQAETEPVEEVVTPDEIDAELEDAPVDEPETVQVEAQPEDEPETMQAEDTSLAATVTPPEEIPLGTEVSADSNASDADQSLNASLNESENETEEEDAAEEEDEEREAVNRIWREGDPTDYTWDWKSFSGFFYDMENDVGTETLNVVLDSGRTIEEGNLAYRTDGGCGAFRPASAKATSD